LVQPAPRELIDGLYVRAVGDGQTVVVLHGGPDFDHTYLLPEMDRVADAARLVYYDQRGRGRSAHGVAAEDVSLESEIADLDTVRRALGLESVAVLGHSWGGLLTMEYAARHPDRVSHLILMNTAPASEEDSRDSRDWLDAHRPQTDADEMQAIRTSGAYQRGDVDAELQYYRAHFRMAIGDPAQVERVVGRLRTHFTSGTVLLARAIEQRLYDETWRVRGYDPVARVRQRRVPTLVIHGDRDFVPVGVAERIAGQLPLATLLVLRDCGHFAYLERPEEVRAAVADLLTL
jgi:proline iminopeptidase